MREEAAAEEPNWFSQWEEELPTPEELMPLSQTLITPNLALAFDIPTSNGGGGGGNPNPNPGNSIAPSPPANHLHHHHLLANPLPSSNDFDSADLGSSGANTSGGTNGGGDEPARTLKRPRLVWTPQLHKRFVDAVAHLGIKNAVPKTIMQLMSVDGLTRENVASHLQKYRLYLKRMQGLGGASGRAGGGSGGSISAADDQLFSSGPIPQHFLTRGGGGGGGGGGGDPYGQYVPLAAIQHHHQQQMAVAAAAAAAARQQFYHQRQIGHFGSAPGIAANGNGVGVAGGGGSFDNGFLSRGLPPPQHGLHGIVPPMVTPGHTMGSYVDDSEERNGGSAGGRRVLTLFPTGED